MVLKIKRTVKSLAVLVSMGTTLPAYSANLVGYSDTKPAKQSSFFNQPIKPSAVDVGKYTSGFGGGSIKDLTDSASSYKSELTSQVSDKADKALNDALDATGLSSLSSYTPSVTTGNPVSLALTSGAMVGGAYCSTFGGPLASANGLQQTGNAIISTIASDISRSTGILQGTIQTEIRKASQTNTAVLTNAQESRDKQFEAGLGYQYQMAKDADKAATDTKLSQEMDISKINSTNACFSSGYSWKQKLAEGSSRRVKGELQTTTRNYNRSIGDSRDYRKIYDTLSDKENVLDDTTSIVDMVEPGVLTEKEMGLAIYSNSVTSNLAPAKRVPKDLEETAKGRHYKSMRRVHEKKLEAAQAIANDELSRKAAVMPLDREEDINLIKQLGEQESESGMVDQNGQPIKRLYMTSDNETSLSVWERAQVAQYHSNSEWQSRVNGMWMSTKAAEHLKVDALALDFIYKLYLEQRKTNVLLSKLVIADLQDESKELSDLYEQVVNQ